MVAADVPQEMIEPLNSVAWAQVNGMVPKLSRELKMAIPMLKLPKKRKGQTSTGTGGQCVNSDVPQAILDPFNAIDWANVSPEQRRRLRGAMDGMIAFKGLPYR